MLISTRITCMKLGSCNRQETLTTKLKAGSIGREIVVTPHV